MSKYFKILKLRYMIGVKGRHVSKNANYLRQKLAFKALKQHSKRMVTMKTMRQDRQSKVMRDLFSHWFTEMQEKRNVKDFT